MLYPYLEIQPDKLTPYKSSIFYDKFLKRFVIHLFYKNEDRFVYDKSITKIYKTIRDSYIDINYTFNYPSTFLKKEKLFNLLGEVKSRKKQKTTIMNLLALLMEC